MRDASTQTPSSETTDNALSSTEATGDGLQLNNGTAASKEAQRKPQRQFGRISALVEKSGITVDYTNPQQILGLSLFPNVPPYLNFSSPLAQGPEVWPELGRYLRWRDHTYTPLIYCEALFNSGFKLVECGSWLGVWGKQLSYTEYQKLKPYQKVNHIPGSFELGRKDTCWKRLCELRLQHETADFDIMPQTYVLPEQYEELWYDWPQLRLQHIKNWILKPASGARGEGIRIINTLYNIPKKRRLILQRYIERPLLINGVKCDLRLYVVLTSFHPLRIYMYEEGLVRLASEPYNNAAETLQNELMHLTNYSINKHAKDAGPHKWSLSQFWPHIKEVHGVERQPLWARIQDIIIRAIVASEPKLQNGVQVFLKSDYSCFELYGVDILLDSDFRPWLLEFNISPAMPYNSEADLQVKASLVQSLMNVALYNVPPVLRVRDEQSLAKRLGQPQMRIGHDERLYCRKLTRRGCRKQLRYTLQRPDRSEYLDTILEQLTPEDVRCLVISEDELARCGVLKRIFPTQDTHVYLKYLSKRRYYNLLLDAWEQRNANDRSAGIERLRALCAENVHLEMPRSSSEMDTDEDEDEDEDDAE